MTALFSRLSLLGTVALAAGCVQPQPPEQHTDKAGSVVTEWALPATAGASAVNLSLAADGRLFLSWMKPIDERRQALQYTTYGKDGIWQSAPKNVAVGGSMVVDRADPPFVTASSDGMLWALWLQRTRSGEHEGRDPVIARSRNDGMNWTDLIRLNESGQSAEHGFASFWTDDQKQIGVAWLSGEPASDGQPHGATSLYATTLSATNSAFSFNKLDTRVCECCQTDSALTSRGPVIAYRDRSEDNIRDISVIRFDNQQWQQPVTVANDGWKIDACPVNGPGIAAHLNTVAVAWYSGAGEKPSLKVALSTDAGDTFKAPVVVDQGEAVLGRTDVAIDAKHVWVIWLRDSGNGQSLWYARYSADLGKELARAEIKALNTKGEGAGYPKLIVRDGVAHVTWSEQSEGSNVIRGVKIAIK